MNCSPPRRTWPLPRPRGAAWLKLPKNCEASKETALCPPKGLAFSRGMINNIAARWFSLCTGKVTGSRPFGGPNEDLIVLQTGHWDNCLALSKSRWLNDGCSGEPAGRWQSEVAADARSVAEAVMGGHENLSWRLGDAISCGRIGHGFVALWEAGDIPAASPPGERNFWIPGFLLLAGPALFLPRAFSLLLPFPTKVPFRLPSVSE